MSLRLPFSASPTRFFRSRSVRRRHWRRRVRLTRARLWIEETFLLFATRVVLFILLLIPGPTARFARRSR